MVTARCMLSSLVLVMTGGDGTEIDVTSESRRIQSQCPMIKLMFIHQISRLPGGGYWTRGASVSYSCANHYANPTIITNTNVQVRSDHN